MADIEREISIKKVDYNIGIDNVEYSVDAKNPDISVDVGQNDYSIDIGEALYNVDIENINYSIDIKPQQSFEIDLNEQGPPGPQGVPGPAGSHPISLEPISQEGYNVTYRFTYSDGTTYDFVVTNGTGITKWLQINEDEWVRENDVYRYSSGGSYSVISVYKGDINNKELVDNINVSIIGPVTYLYSLQPFSGYALMAAIGESQVDYVYIHEQNIASSVWNIEHNLNTFPSITIVNSAGEVVVGDMKYIDANNIRITFKSEFKGVAYLNYTR